ncbi:MULTISPECIES: hypothetical protein [Euryhalocaulis]|uniref:hypothetical protein n=1 Tax=Euryhalocaulis TaxID=1712422 RepID=UPI0003A9C04D|nr:MULTISPECIES: hypothetical protein [Euryhalocaulis]
MGECRLNVIALGVAFGVRELRSFGSSTSDEEFDEALFEIDANPVDVIRFVGQQRCRHLFGQID